MKPTNGIINHCFKLDSLTIHVDLVGKGSLESSVLDSRASSETIQKDSFTKFPGIMKPKDLCSSKRVQAMIQT